MGKRNPPLLPFNKKNLLRVQRLIVKNLTIDLLPKKWITENLQNPRFGHCHNAAGCLYKIFSSNSVHMYRALDKANIWHWWVQDKDGNIIDPTADQYKLREVKILYKKGEKASLLGFDYKKRVNTLLSRVRDDLKI